MFYVKLPNGQYYVYVISDAGELNPARGEKNVRENEYPDQKYYHFVTKTTKDFSKIEDIETDLYISGLRCSQSLRNEDGCLFERKEELRKVKDALENKLMDVSSDIEIVTSAEIKSDLETIDFFKTSDEIKRYYYKNEGEMMVIAIKGIFSEEDDMFYLDTENNFLEMQVKKLTAGREDLLSSMKEYVDERGHEMLVMPSMKFVYLYKVMHENTKVMAENKEIPENENTIVERRRPRYI